MPLTGEPELVDFDAETALERTRDVCGDSLQSFMEFTQDEYNIVHVADEVLEMYRDEEHLHDHYSRVLDHLHMDFMERDTYENTLLPNAGTVTSLVTHMDSLTLLRVFDGEAGLYIALDPGCSAEAVTEAIEPLF
ncbi:MAG: hypothetical protein ACI8UR_001993 [Natronomonas sp.]|jgi:hypothetical protein|uniref:hypothetical protein n=1 Tax=Natronomonas sp. TaxID=2184060 RepID=UPI003989380A